MIKKTAPNSQLGQTLIETVVAVFILVTALITATGLAYYSFRSSDNSSREIIGTALAREGIEGVKNIRDSNWQSGTLSACDSEIGAGRKCYLTWNAGLNAGDYAVDYNANSNNWTVTPAINLQSYELNFDASTGNPSSGTYSTQNPPNGSGFFRRINIAYDTTAPFSSTSPRLIITATVWWTSRSCPFSAGDNASLAALPASCKVALVMHLTNWKNY